MSVLEIVLTGFIVVLVVLLLALVFGKERKSKDRVIQAYAEGLSHIVNGEYGKAVKKLKFVVNRDTDNIDAYVKLGLAYRRMGNSKSALGIHKNLLYREGLSKEQKLDIFRNIVEDLEYLGDERGAVQWCEKIVDMDRRNKWAIDKLWDLYPVVGEWDKAIDLLKRFPQRGKGKIKRKSAIYKTAEGLRLLNEGKYHDSRLIFKKAIKYDPSCEAPYFYIAESYFREGRIRDALMWWEKYLEISPDKSRFVVRKIEKALFEIGSFDRIGTLYERLVEKVPRDVGLVISLALFYEKKGKLEEGIDVIDRYWEEEGGELSALIAKARLFISKEKMKEAGCLLDDVLEKLRVAESFECKNCGYKSEDVRWICPECKEIDTFF